MKIRNLLGLGFAVCCICTSSLAQNDPKAKESTPEHFAAVAYVRRAAARSMSHVDIRLAQYSSDEETQALAQQLISNGSDALLKSLQDKKAIGRIQLSGRVGWYDFKLVRSRPTEDGRRIVAITDRPIGFLEAYNSGRSKDYKFGVLVLDLKTDSKGKEIGEGTLYYASKIKVKGDNTVEIEHFGIDPVTISNARKY